MYAPLRIGGEPGSSREPTLGVTGDTDGNPALTGDPAIGAGTFGEADNGGVPDGRGGGGESGLGLACRKGFTFVPRSQKAKPMDS